ncbi:Putative deaminase [Tolypocladium paradoxum]|uniref:Deaminase n=1 Tax=Tolypocladium paradoxum TaxID=94208 RepID=A0A2S4KMZ8_9HYPO|nr:Putative deaminase [Tolypocladium paradoxum]
MGVPCSTWWIICQIAKARLPVATNRGPGSAQSLPNLINLGRRWIHGTWANRLESASTDRRASGVPGEIRVAGTSNYQKESGFFQIAHQQKTRTSTSGRPASTWAGSTELVAGLLERHIGLTLCPHAYHRRTATDGSSRMDRGVSLCINSDDPVYVWIDGNMQKAYHYAGLSKAEMVRLARKAVDKCWADERAGCLPLR